MEALGTASAIITIWDLVGKARRMHGQIKAAPGAWKLYCDDLESLAHVQIVVKDMIQNTPRMTIPIIEVREGESQNLMTFLNNNLGTVRKQATNILDQHDLATNRSISGKRFLEWLKFKKASYMFVLDEQEIKSLREAVESAKSTLQLALQLLFTSKFFSGEQRMQDELRNIHDSMKRQAVGLEAIEKNRKLSQIPLKVYCGKGSASGLKRLKLASLRLGRPTSKSNRGFEALVNSGTFTVSQLVESEARPLPGTESQVITFEKQDVLDETKEETQDPDVTDTRVDTSNTNDDKTGDKWEDQQDGNHSSLSKSLIRVRREKPQNRQYDLVWRNGDIFSIGTDTDVYKAAFEAQLGDYQGVTMFRLDDLLESLTDAQQGQDATAQNDLRDVLALEIPFPDESDTEPTTKSFSIQIDYQRPTYAFVGNGVDLGQSIFDTTTSLPFCAWVICDLQPCQIFALQEPCNGASLPYTMTFRSMSYSMLLDEEAAIGTQEELTLESFNRCQKKNGCRHTVVEGVVSPEACCVRSVNLRAWLGDDFVEREAVTSTEDGASYDDSISVEPTLDDDHDERALDLLQAVMNGMANDSDIPARIELDVLVSYIKVVDKYELGELYLSQGLAWADALLPKMSTSFDEDAIAWLWILWRLHMPTEFNKLSAIIAQQAQGRIGPEHDRHGVEIPESIIDAIEQKRVHALSQQSWAGPTWVRESGIISSAVTVEYLTLETQKHLPCAQEGYNPNFPGVSFEDTAKWIRSMINLGDWRIRAVPPARRRFQFLANLSFFVPFLGVGLHEVEYYSGLFSHVYEELTNLITRLEAEDWGMDLDRVTCEL
ncbi:hypothetical protein H9L39_12282 [Fusarium oxysporum f. sp. albedinis]|nr:hypothetical protein H9L39_12282 [Fusarium oxysporum f. sp. albedinis]